MRRFSLLILAIALCTALAGCGRPGETADGAVRLLLDGEAVQGGSLEPEKPGLRVYVTLDGAPLIDLPFSDKHTLTIAQPDGGENTVAITGSGVHMESANCEGQDCVNMGEVTEENLELRVLGGFIVCLPHKLSVEVRGM